MTTETATYLVDALRVCSLCRLPSVAPRVFCFQEASMPRKKTTILALHEKKARGEPITMITAYDYPGALAADRAGLDSILVGDSLGMVVLGYDSTVPVTMDEMIHHCKAVRRGAQYAYLIGDLPFHLLPGRPRRGGAQRGPLPEGGRHGCRQAGGRPADGGHGAGDHGRRDDGGRPHRPHAAVGRTTQRLPGAGQDRGGCPTPAGGCPGVGASRRGHDRAGDGAGSGGRADFA